MEFLQNVRRLSPDSESELLSLESLYDKKLWHQLSLELERSLLKGKSCPLLNQPNIYEEFVATFESKINGFKLASIIHLIGRNQSDPQQAIELFQNVVNSKNKLSAETKICISLEIAMMKIKLGLIAEAKNIIHDAKTEIDGLQNIESMIHSKFYKATMELKKVIGPPHEYYQAAVKFLSYTPIEDINEEEKHQLAIDIALSAVSSEGIYNFGEVLATPILDCLDVSSFNWLKQLVIAMNKGNLSQFNEILNQHAVEFQATPALSTRENFIREKAVLLCIVNYAFERPALQRQIDFQDLSQVTNLHLSQIERALMKAMSLKLLKGTIDEVDQSVQITWVHPRVLDKNQLELMNAQVQNWSERVKTALLAMEDQTLELLS